jgi:hypothetical protein
MENIFLEKVKSVIDKESGELLYATIVEVELLENEILIDEVLEVEMDNPYYNFETKQFYNK